MTANLPTPSGEPRQVVVRDAEPTGLGTEDTAGGAGQNVAAGLVPFAIITFLVIVLVVAAWTLAAAGRG